jgi:hypothetical protein
MKALWIAAGVGFTAYCVINHAPTWVIVLNVIIDAHMIITFVRDR